MSLSAHGVVARLGSFTLGPLSVEVPAEIGRAHV